MNLDSAIFLVVSVVCLSIYLGVTISKIHEKEKNQ